MTWDSTGPLTFEDPPEPRLCLSCQQALSLHRGFTCPQPPSYGLHCPHDKDPDDCMHCADAQPLPGGDGK